MNSHGIISTVAGSGSPMFPRLSGPREPIGDGGPATDASLGYPTGVAVLPGGGYLIADVGDNRVRMVNAQGMISTVAGTGAVGSGGDGGPATKAALDGPEAVAVLPHGGFLIAELHGNRIRRVDAQGTITTVAGTGRWGIGGDGGPATDAGLTEPKGVALLPGGGFLIAEADGVRRVDSHGIIATAAGSKPFVRSGNVEFPVEPARAEWSGLSDGLGGPAIDARIAPLSVAVEPDGSILVGAFTHVLVLASGTHPPPAVAIRPPAIVNGFIHLNVISSEPGRERVVVRRANNGRRVAAFTESVGSGVSGFSLPRTPSGTLTVRVTLHSQGHLATDETAIVSGHVLPLSLARSAIAFRCCSGTTPVVTATRARLAQEAEDATPSIVSCRRFSATRVDCQWGWQHRCTEAASAILRNALVYLTVYTPCTFARHPRHRAAPWIAPLL
ncbi:MAG TPA: hypothetical protein VMB91_09645 [Solirubrobacteraceae bacterium]|nr:hypothetical protein [Solirubrobacteraceae bacterium]